MDGRNILKTLTIMKIKQNEGILPVGGYSMLPLLVPGDRIKIQALSPDQYKIGDIIICIDPKVQLLVHRIIRITRDTNSGHTIYITKGDNSVATESIESQYCLGKVVEVSNKNGKQLKIQTPKGIDKLTVFFSKKVNEIYADTCDPNIALSSRYHMWIHDIAPDYLKKFVYQAQDYMIQMAKNYILQYPPDELEDDGTFVFTKDFYAMLVNHRVVNILYPYILSNSGRFSKVLKLARANRYVAAQSLKKWCCKICAALEEAGISYVVFKGIATSCFAYGSPTTRECDDIDFLIDKTDIQKAHTIMNGLGFYSHNAQGKFRTEEPTFEYPTHLTPYALPEAGVTAEIHTAIYLNEKHTPEILARRQQILVDDQKIYVLDDADLYLCQMYTTAVDDYGCSNMSFEEDPNIFLKLKFRNYVDILLLVNRFRQIPAETLLALAVKYDVNFYVYLALYYTGKIFGQNNTGKYQKVAELLAPVQRLADTFRQYEDLDKKLFRFPIDAHACLLSPFKMKMNGKALRKLRDAFYMSEDWRRKQAELQNPELTRFEIRAGAGLQYEENGLLVKIRSSGKNLLFEFEMDAKTLENEIIIAVCGMHTEKYKSSRDYKSHVAYKYVNFSQMKGITGSFRINSVMPWEDRMNELYHTLFTKRYNAKFPVKIRKKCNFCANIEMKHFVTGIKYDLNNIKLKKPFGYSVFSVFLFEFSGKKMVKMHRNTPNIYENLKISFD